jgi:predicted small lipoprotein YifL
MTRLLFVLALLGLAGCGADGDPFVPEAAAPPAASGVSVSGSVTMGINT